MPYQIQRVKDGYFVVDTKGKKLENKPLKTLKQAQKQRVAVYLSKKNAGKDVKHFFI
jgi:hypothetical protein